MALRENEQTYCLLASLNRDPITYKEAIKSKEKESWKIAIREE